MQMQTGRHWHRGVLAALAVLALTACNAGDPNEAPQEDLGGSEAELSCQVSQQCANGTSITCGSASGICHSGTENGGWVECDGSRTYCPTPCTCDNVQRTELGYAASFGCPAAWLLARNEAIEIAHQQCPQGVCNLTWADQECFRTNPPNNPWGAYVTVTYSCMGPANCQ
ncbi:hypothetical protein ACLEPN_37570 [Myxococcus sp. 1LA]